MCANGVVIALGRLLEPQRRLPQDSRGMCIGMLVCCFAGLVLQYLWVRICQAAVHKCDRNLESTATVTVGGLAFWPLIMAYLVLLGRWPSTSSGQATILVPLGVWLVLRMALWWHMKVLIEVLEEPDMRAALSSSGGEADVLGADDLPQALAPLIRGAWLVGFLARRGLHCACLAAARLCEPLSFAPAQLQLCSAGLFSCRRQPRLQEPLHPKPRPVTPVSPDRSNEATAHPRRPVALAGCCTRRCAAAHPCCSRTTSAASSSSART